MITENHTVSTKQGDILPVIMQRPERNGKFPVVILVQGIGMDMHEYKNIHDEIALYLAKAGFITVQFDFSYQKHVTLTEEQELPLEKRALEVDDVIAWVHQQKNIDNSRIGLYAMSFGVSTTLVAKRDGIRSLCLVCGLGFRPKKFAERYIKKGAVIHKHGKTKLPRSNGKYLLVDPDFWPSFDALVQEDLAKQLNIPTLVIHGTNDSYIATEDMQSVYEAIASKEKKRKIFSDGDHGIVDVPRRMREEFLAEIVEWFRITLC